MSNSNHSLSRISINIILNDGNVIKAELIRHLSPLTIRRLINSMPLSGGVYRFGDSFVYIQTDIKMGAEKPINQFRMGEIAFSPLTGIFCVFVKECMIAQKFSLIGEVISDNIDILSSIKAGQQMSVRKADFL